MLAGGRACLNVRQRGAAVAVELEHVGPEADKLFGVRPGSNLGDVGPFGASDVLWK